MSVIGTDKSILYLRYKIQFCIFNWYWEIFFESFLSTQHCTWDKNKTKFNAHRLIYFVRFLTVQERFVDESQSQLLALPGEVNKRQR